MQDVFATKVSFEAFCQTFVDRYGSLQSEDDEKTTLDGLRQGLTETAREYSQRIRQTVANMRYKPDESHLLRTFARLQQQSHAIAIADMKTLDEATAKLTKLEMIAAQWAAAHPSPKPVARVLLSAADAPRPHPHDHELPRRAATNVCPCVDFVAEESIWSQPVLSRQRTSAPCAMRALPTTIPRGAPIQDTPGASPPGNSAEPAPTTATTPVVSSNLRKATVFAATSLAIKRGTVRF